MATVKSADAEARFREYAERLPSLPAVAMEVVRLAKQDWVDLSEMAEVVGHDPALSAKILKLANAPLYLRRATVATLPEAVTTLGINTLKMAALSFSVTGIAGAQSDVGGYKLTAFWRRALIQSIAGRSMATIFLRKGAEEAFLLGLLMDLSVPVLARLGGADYGPVVAAMISGHPDRDAETAALGFDHAKLSSRLLRSWSLPDVLVHAAAWHHDPDAAPTGSPKAATDLARIANLAHLSAEVMTSERKGGALAELQTRAAAWFGAEQETLITMLQEMSPAVDELAEIVKVDMGCALDAAAILEQAREELAQVSLAAAGELARAESRMSKLEKEATTDALTDLNNRATFDATLLS
jgi:HD-like signal output (HDOD) protein